MARTQDEEVDSDPSVKKLQGNAASTGNINHDKKKSISPIPPEESTLLYTTGTKFMKETMPSVQSSSDKQPLSGLHKKNNKVLPPNHTICKSDSDQQVHPQSELRVFDLGIASKSNDDETKEACLKSWVVLGRAFPQNLNVPNGYRIQVEKECENQVFVTERLDHQNIIQLLGPNTSTLLECGELSEIAAGSAVENEMYQVSEVTLQVDIGHSLHKGNTEMKLMDGPGKQKVDTLKLGVMNQNAAKTEEHATEGEDEILMQQVEEIIKNDPKVMEYVAMAEAELSEIAAGSAVENEMHQVSEVTLQVDIGHSLHKGNTEMRLMDGPGKQKVDTLKLGVMNQNAAKTEEHATEGEDEILMQQVEEIIKNDPKVMEYVAMAEADLYKEADKVKEVKTQQSSEDMYQQDAEFMYPLLGSNTKIVPDRSEVTVMTHNYMETDVSVKTKPEQMKPKKVLEPRFTVGGKRPVPFHDLGLNRRPTLGVEPTSTAVCQDTSAAGTQKPLSLEGDWRSHCNEVNTNNIDDVPESLRRRVVKKKLSHKLQESNKKMKTEDNAALSRMKYGKGTDYVPALENIPNRSTADENKAVSGMGNMPNLVDLLLEFQ